MPRLSCYLAILFIVNTLLTLFNNVNGLQPQQGASIPPLNQLRKPSKALRLKMIPVEEVVDWVQPVTDAANYVFVPPEVSQEIYLGAIIATLPFIWATKTFGTRIVVQRECLVCKGSGLVSVTKQGSTLTRPRKCWSCGGFLPWLGWKMFFFSSFFDIGNGGPLLRPAKDYELTNERIRKGEVDYTVGTKSEVDEDLL
jgi:hypothetical protein